MTLGEYIKQFREARSMTMEEFGKRAGITKQYVSILEKGEKSTVPSIATYEKVAKATNHTLEELAAIVNGSVSLTSAFEEDLREKEEVNAIAEKLHKNPDLRMLFDLADGADPEDLQIVAGMLRRFKETR